MVSTLSQFSWPELPSRFGDALRAAVDFVISEVDPVGIIATGTIVRGTPHASSDLDVYVIHDIPARRRVQRFFGTRVPTEIFINPPAAVRSYFVEEHRDGRPLTAHMFVTGHIVLDRSPVLQQLRQEARDWLDRPSIPSEDVVTRARYGAASAYEDALDVAPNDPATAILLLHRAVRQMLELWCHQRLGASPRAKDLIGRVNDLDPGVATLARRVFSALPFAEQERAAADLAEATSNPRGFFEWDSGFSAVETNPARTNAAGGLARDEATREST